MLDSSDLDDIISGLRDNGLLGKYSYILTGKLHFFFKQYYHLN